MSDPQIKIIRHLPSRVDLPDDKAMPFRVEVNLRPPEFMGVAFAMLYGGSEEIVARCGSREAVDRMLTRDDLLSHPRLRWVKITGPDGVVERIQGSA